MSTSINEHLSICVANTCPCMRMPGTLSLKMHNGITGCVQTKSAVVQVLVPTSQFIRSLVAARLAADVLDVPTVLIARTDAHSAALLTSDVDEVDRAFCTGERTPEGFYRVKEGVKVSHTRLLYSSACDAPPTVGCLLVLCCRFQAGKAFLRCYASKGTFCCQNTDQQTTDSCSMQLWCTGFHCQGPGLCTIC